MAPRLLLGSLLAGALAAPLAAQGGEDAVARCAALGDKDAEIACLRAALGAGAAPGEAAPPQAASAAPAAPPSPAASPELGREQVARATPPERRAQERAAHPEPPRERVLAAVAGASTDHIGRFTVRLDNGQTWRQVDPLGTPVQLRGREGEPVEITRSGFGGYRMRFDGLGRTVAVTRVE